jgi:prepilin-type N-terminal cleavage/methylation domain-containing protein
MARPRPESRSRAGFTLIELLIVIVVIGILAALLVPAVIGAINTAKDAATIGEINGLANSLAGFKDKYGSYPPSRILLNESVPFALYGGIASGTSRPGQVATAGFWLNNASPVPGTDAGSDLTLAALAQRSTLYMQRFFPRASSIPLSNAVAAPFWYDFNGNGSADAPGGFGVLNANWIYLEGYECLVFFLGGIASPIVNPDGTISYGMSGFGKDPQKPFTTNGDPGTNPLPAAMLSLNRHPSFFEWKNDRLGDLDGDGMLDYGDSLSTRTDHLPYVYFSSYDGQGYDPNDQNIAEASDSTGIGPISRLFSCNLGISTTATAHFTGLTANVIESCAPNPYTSSTPLLGGGQKIATFINGNTFQILSPGRDREYGVGGQFDPNANLRLTDDGWMYPGPKASPVSTDGSLRIRERDNLTNFHTSKLD